VKRKYDIYLYCDLTDLHRNKIFSRLRDILTLVEIPEPLAESDDSDDSDPDSDSDDVPVLDDEDENQLNSGYVTTPERMTNARRDLENNLRGIAVDSVDANILAGERVENGMGPDLSLTDMMNDILTLKITKYNYLDSNGCIGGTSSGPARIQFNEIYDSDNEVYTREITPCRIRRAVNGGQIYMPMMLQLMNVNQRKLKYVEQLRGFPMLLVRTLLTRSGSVDSDKTELYSDLIKMHELITVLISDCRMNMRTMSSHPVRIELYYASTLQSEDSDIEFPMIDWKRIISTIRHSTLKRNWTETLVSFNAPLEKVIDGVRSLVQPGSSRTPMLEEYNAKVKTMLVFCAERVISMLNIRGFNGRVIKSLKSQLSGERADRLFWTVPVDQQEELDDDVIESSGLPWGLSPNLLALPGVDDAFISQQQLHTTPAYLEQFNGQLYSELTIPIGYFRYRLRVKILFLKYSLNLRANARANFNFGLFDEPSYTAIALLTEDDRDELMDELCMILSKCYESEWWYMITDRTKSLMRRGMFLPQDGFPYPGKLAEFPITRDQFEKWMRDCRQNHFISRNRLYQADLADVTDVDDFIRMAFLDTEPNSSVSGKSNWDRCISRRMMHLICSELKKVESLASVSTKPHFSLATFKKRVAVHFSIGRHPRGDHSKAIMWKTNTTSSMYSWDEFSPVLIDISENPVPSAARAAIFPPPMETGRGRPMFNGKTVKDTFYRNVVKEDCVRPVQLNSLILYRCILWLQENVDPVQNQSQIKTHHRRFPIGSSGRGLLYDIFFEDKQMFEHASGMIKNMRKASQKELDITESAEINKTYWPPSGGLSDIDLFKYGSADEQRMDGFLDTGNFGDAFIFAQMGYVTKRFMLYFFKVRKKAIDRMRAGQGLSKADCAVIAGW
jgi:hypothetical protein